MLPMMDSRIKIAGIIRKIEIQLPTPNPPLPTPMPHFIIDCSENILSIIAPEELMDAVYQEAESTKLFADGDIKVRIKPYTHYKLGEGKSSFIHIFGNILEGRTTEQKAALSAK